MNVGIHSLIHKDIDTSDNWDRFNAQRPVLVKPVVTTQLCYHTCRLPKGNSHATKPATSAAGPPTPPQPECPQHQSTKQPHRHGKTGWTADATPRPLDRGQTVVPLINTSPAQEGQERAARQSSHYEQRMCVRTKRTDAMDPSCQALPTHACWPQAVEKIHDGDGGRAPLAQGTQHTAARLSLRTTAK